MSTTVRPIEDRRLLGIAMVLGGYFCFTIIDSCAKWLTLSGLPTGEVVFIRYAGQFVLVTAIFAPTSCAITFRASSSRRSPSRNSAGVRPRRVSSC